MNFITTSKSNSILSTELNTVLPLIVKISEEKNIQNYKKSKPYLKLKSILPKNKNIDKVDLNKPNLSKKNNLSIKYNKFSIFEDKTFQIKNKNSSNLLLNSAKVTNPSLSISNLKKTNSYLKQDIKDNDNSNSSSSHKSSFAKFSLFKSNEDENNGQFPIFEDPETLLNISKHPNIIKQGNSKADKILKEWLDNSGGKLTKNQNSILGNSLRIKRKTTFYLVNKINEGFHTDNLGLDEKILGKKKFRFAQKCLEEFEKIYEAKEINDSKKNEIFQEKLGFFYELHEISKQLIEKNNDKNKILDFAKKFLSLMLKLKITEGLIINFKFFGKICMILKDYNNSIKLYKSVENLSRLHKLPRYLLSAFKYFGLIYKSLGEYRLALRMFWRMLSLSWFLKEEKYEFLSYDMIGMIYYYLGFIEQAKFYHLKMLKGIIEPEDSIARKLAINKIKEEISGDKIINILNETSIEERDLLFEGINNFEEIFTKDRKNEIEKRIFLKKEKHDSSVFNQNLKKSDLLKKKTKREVIKKIIFEKTPILITHLSNNRFSNNFEINSPKNNRNNEKIEILETENNLNVKVEKSGKENLFIMFKKLKNNLELCIIKLEFWKTRLSKDNRRRAMIIRK